MRYFTPEELKNSRREEVASQLSNLAGKNVKYNFAIEVFQKYSKQLSINTDAKILDLGTANGDFLQQLYDRGYANLYGHDLDDYFPKERRGILKEYKLSELSMEKLPWPENYFDAVTAWCILPHLENPFHCAREAYRVLKNGGVFIFTAIHLISKPSTDYFLRHKDFKSYRETNNHIALLPQSVVKKTILKNFRLVGTEYFLIPKIFNGWRGKIRKFVLQLASRKPQWENWLKSRWAYNICYILQKES